MNSEDKQPTPETQIDGSVAATARGEKQMALVRRRPRRYLITVLLVGGMALLGLWGGLLAARFTPPTYSATSTYYAVVTGAKTPEALATMNSIINSRAQSYVALIQTNAVLEPVIKEKGLDIAPEALAKQLTLSVVPETIVFSITVSDQDPERAAMLAGAIGESASKVVPTFEDLHNTGASFKLINVTAAAVPTVPSSPSAPVNMLVGTITGALLGYVIAAFLAGYRRKARLRAASAATDDVQ